jgi:hypothetical protein
MAKLHELLTEEEKNILSRNFSFNYDGAKDVTELTVRELAGMGLELIRTEYNWGMMPSCVISAEAINILTKRAKEKKISIY